MMRWCTGFQLELLAAKNLIGANLNGTSDPYAMITCGTEKRFRLPDFVFLYRATFCLMMVKNRHTHTRAFTHIHTIIYMSYVS